MLTVFEVGEAGFVELQEDLLDLLHLQGRAFAGPGVAYHQ